MRVLDGPVTAASALKMSYAGITKVVHCTRRDHDARGNGAAVRPTLSGRNWLRADPTSCGTFQNQAPSMYSKAYRWVAELDEIASFVGGRACRA